jgi:crotonobetainyl-CoA:carnitine CoA-transferase CaiB-like acyl-CoA transferase
MTGTGSHATCKGPLDGLTVLDLSKVLAGPWSTQILGDLGAEVLKVELPGVGDETRRWGPPFLEDGSNDAAYYLSANRNKRALAIKIATAEGADLIRALVAKADIVVENFKVGALARYGLDYQALSAIKPDLIYCSITGFGQEGPHAHRGGYDFLVQGMSGLMSVTGFPDDQGGAPTKVGVPVSDLFTGLYASISILAAVTHRLKTGEGQHIDCALLDTQMALLANQASNYLNGGMVPGRLGNEHPNVVPYQDFATSDGHVLVAIGTDKQFRDFCTLIGLEALGTNEAFATNAGRSVNRRALQDAVRPALARWTSADLLAAMKANNLPGGPVNSVPEALSDPQVEAHHLIQSFERDGRDIHTLAFPAKLSRTPATYRHAPPVRGADTFAVLSTYLGLSPEQLDALSAQGIIEDSPR